MKIPYANLYEEYLECKAEVDFAIKNCIDNSNFIGGNAVIKFEIEWANYTGCEDCAGTSSGTSALFLSLLSLGIGVGDEVIVPAMSFMSTAEVVNQLGAKPVFIDIDQYYTINIDAIKSSITERTKAIIFVDLYGQTIDIQHLDSVCEGIPLIRDAAQSAVCYNTNVDVNEYVYATCYSFYPGKNLSAMGDAGAVTGSKELCDKIRYYRDHARTEKYVHTGIGYNERLDAMQAAIVSAKIPFLKKWNAQRDNNAKYYLENLKGSGVLLPLTNPCSNHVWNQFVIVSSSRSVLRNYLADHGIETGLQFPIALHQQPVYKSVLQLPNSEELAATCLSLPIFAQLQQNELEYIVNCIWNYSSS
jgi:dTDP-4-amino-4,6-dideoxygalactose transaminase